MNLNFSQIIRSIESEIKFDYLPDAIRWCDEHLEGAWSKSIDRFENALINCIERKDYTSVQAEGAYYKNSILDLLNKYKEKHNHDQINLLIESLDVSRVKEKK